MMRKFLIATCAVVGTVVVGCSKKVEVVPLAPQAVRDRSFIDLQPGMTVRVILPLLKSGDYRVNTVPEQITGNTISLRADDLLGYLTTTYEVTGTANYVKLEFTSAQETRAGKTVKLDRSPNLPFAFPERASHIRLVFLTRLSQSDHNMAILGAKHRDKLESFTAKLSEQPDICASRAEVVCSWVPAGIAVRAESRKQSAKAR